MRSASRRGRPALLICLCLALFPLAGCGGGGDGESTSSQASTAQAETAPAPARKEGDRSGEEQGANPQSTKPTRHSPAEPDPPIAAERTPGSKAVAPGVPVTKGGDNSIQAFGEEGEESEAEQATKNLSAYLGARAANDWSGACEATSTQFKEELGKLIEQAKAKENVEKPRGCTDILAALFGKAPLSSLREAARIDRVLSFRTDEDGYAYLIFEARGEVKFIAMANDDGAWKVNVLEPEAFQGIPGEDQ